MKHSRSFPRSSVFFLFRYLSSYCALLSVFWMLNCWGWHRLSLRCCPLGRHWCSWYGSVHGWCTSWCQNWCSVSLLHRHRNSHNFNKEINIIFLFGSQVIKLKGSFAKPMGENVTNLVDAFVVESS